MKTLNGVNHASVSITLFPATLSASVVNGRTLSIYLDKYGFREISLHLGNDDMAQELADAINSIVAKHTAKEAA